MISPIYLPPSMMYLGIFPGGAHHMNVYDRIMIFNRICDAMKEVIYDKNQIYCILWKDERLYEEVLPT